MTEGRRWIELLKESGALQTGHFLLSSGLHSAQYVQCGRALENPANASALGAALARRLAGSNIDRVVSPPLGALLVGYEVARSLERPFLFPERTKDGGFSLRRGFAVRPGECLAVIEDVITTGRTTREVIELLRAYGSDVVALGAIVDRSEGDEIEGIPIVSLINLSIPTYEQGSCPLCAAGIPLVKPGSRTGSEETR